VLTNLQKAGVDYAVLEKGSKRISGKHGDKAFNYSLYACGMSNGETAFTPYGFIADANDPMITFFKTKLDGSCWDTLTDMAKTLGLDPKAVKP